MRIGSKIQIFAAYVAVVLVISIGLIEIYGKFIDEGSDIEREKKFLEADPLLGWANRPNLDAKFESKQYKFSGEVHFDAQGLRPSMNPAVAGNSNFKILLVGDSTTTGMEVDDTQTFGSDLERLLNTAGRATSSATGSATSSAIKNRSSGELKTVFNVINAGVRGYGADQTYLRLKQLLPIVKPDLVLFMASRYGIQQLTSIKNWYRPFSKPAFALESGDLKLFNSPVRPMEKEEYSFLVYHGNQFEVKEGFAKPSGIARFLREHSYLYARLDALYFTNFYARGNQRAIAPPGGITEEKKMTFEKLAVEMRKISPKFYMTGFTVVKGGPVPEYDLFKDLAKKNGIEFLDIRPFFKPHTNYVFGNDGHWNQLGHQTGAEALYAELAPRLGLNVTPTKEAPVY